MMRRVVLSVVALLMFGCEKLEFKNPVASEEIAEKFPVNVLTYNIHHGEGTDGIIDLDRIADVIRSVDPDLVSLQEVDRFMLRSDSVDQAKILGELLGMKAIFVPNMRFSKGEYGNAVLVKSDEFLVVDDTNHFLPSTTEQRGMLEVELAKINTDVPRDVLRFYFFATHLDHQSQNTRIASVDSIEKIVLAKAGKPMIVAGDLNDTPQSTTITMFKKFWKLAGEGETLWTFPASMPRKQLDYILFYPSRQWNDVEVKVVADDSASDHRPLLVQFELYVKYEQP